MTHSNRADHSLITREEWIAAIDELVRAARAARAPHRLILVLFLLRRAEAGQSGAVTFLEVEAGISPALALIGRAAKPEPLLPFWHLQSSPFWVVENAGALPRRQGKDRPTRRTLVEQKARGMVLAAWWAAVLGDQALRAEVIKSLLEAVSDSTSVRSEVATILGFSLRGQRE